MCYHLLQCDIYLARRALHADISDAEKVTAIALCERLNARRARIHHSLNLWKSC